MHIGARARGAAGSLPRSPLLARLLSAGERYELLAHLTLPDSSANRAASVFMLHAEVLTANGSVLARSARPLALPYASWPVRYLWRALTMAPVVLGVWTERVHLRARLLDQYAEPRAHPSAGPCRPPAACSKIGAG